MKAETKQTERSLNNKREKPERMRRKHRASKSPNFTHYRENQRMGYLRKSTAGTNGRDAFQKTQINGQDLISQSDIATGINGHK